MIAELTDVLVEVRNLLKRGVVQDGNITRKPRRSREQLRQLSIALAALEKDPLHNVKKAAEFAFKKAKGYVSVDSLRHVLASKWNARVD